MMREHFHRKAFYCTRCRMRINHIEVRNAEEAEIFRRNFEAGAYAAEAEASAAYARDKEGEMKP